MYSISKWRFSCWSNGHTGPPQLCWPLSLEWIAYFEHVVQSPFNTYLLVSVLRFTPNHIPVNYRCPFKVRYWIRHIYLKQNWLWDLTGTQWLWTRCGMTTTSCGCNSANVALRTSILAKWDPCWHITLCCSRRGIGDGFNTRDPSTSSRVRPLFWFFIGCFAYNFNNFFQLVMAHARGLCLNLNEERPILVHWGPNSLRAPLSRP